MRMNTLVMSRNAGAIQVLVAAFAELGIEYRVLLSASETIETLASGRHSALIVDFDLPQVLEVVKVARTLASRRRPVLFGMIGNKFSIESVFQAGANFVLYKPLDIRQIRHTFRLAQGVIAIDRRGTTRRAIETLAYLDLPQGTIPALIYELTGEGLSLQAGEPLIPLRAVRMRFLLPAPTTQVVHARGDIVWADKAGRAGLFFSHIPAGCRRDLDSWLRKHSARMSQPPPSVLPERNKWPVQPLSIY
ncbi:MAG: hypothetical protein JO356_13580 [Acidobacteria bacterium]|nr:hypothetical protein [Acidobacteriota bacterium]